MQRIDRIIGVLETIRELEKRIDVENDPRERADMASTLSLLNTSLDYEVRKYASELGRGEEDEAA